MLNSSFFEKNRRKFQEKLKSSSLSIFFSSDENIKGDTEFFDIPDVNLFHLTGINQAKTKFIITNNQVYLFIQKTSDYHRIWEGEKLSLNQAKKISGIQNIHYLEEFEEIFEELSKKIKNIYLYKQPKSHSQIISTFEQFIRKTKRKIKTNYENSYEIIRDLRQIKSDEEIKQIQKTMKITQASFEQVRKNLKTFKSEQEVEALLTYNYTKNLAKHAYHPIVASGKNSCILHYIKNNKNFQKNDLLLIDSGAELNNYKTDISRTFPISGKFTKRQKQVYQAVLDIQKFALKNLKPELDRKEWEKQIAYFAADKLIELKLFTKEQFEKDNSIIRKYYPHSTGHFLGLDTHDIGDYSKPFSQGEVYTVEPGIYIQKENIGIRIEDNVLITKTGCKVLSKAIPKEIDEIEF